MALDQGTPAAGDTGEGGSRPWYRRWYVWAGIGAVVVAGAVVGGVVGSRSGAASPPTSTFGHREFFPLRSSW